MILKVPSSGTSLQESISNEAASEDTSGNTGFGRFESGNGLDRFEIRLDGVNPKLPFPLAVCATLVKRVSFFLRLGFSV